MRGGFFSCCLKIETILQSPVSRTVSHAKHNAQRETACRCNLLFVQFENSHECFLRNLNGTQLTHTFFTFLLFFQKFLLT